MKLKFTIHYGTQWGESLHVVVCYLSADGTRKTANLLMQTDDGTTWTLETSVVESRQHPIVSFSYHYQVEDEEGHLLRREWTMIPRTYHFDTSKSYVLSDLWRDIPIQYHLYSSAYMTTKGLACDEQVQSFNHTAEALLLVGLGSYVHPSSGTVVHHDAIEWPVHSGNRRPALPRSLSEGQEKERSVLPVKVLNIHLRENIEERIIVHLFYASPLVVPGHAAQNAVLNRRESFHEIRFLFSRSHDLLIGQRDRGLDSIVHHISTYHKTDRRVALDSFNERFPPILLEVFAPDMEIEHRDKRDVFVGMFVYDRLQISFHSSPSSLYLSTRLLMYEFPPAST